MSPPAIEVSGLSKRYVIQHESRHDNLRDTLHHTARKLWRRMRWGTGFSTEEFWALRDVSFSVQPGEVVGIIGRNGAGKSTLLKVLSRITEPTSGKVKLRGRVASLLEVGTGFHPELTGRENIFLNGAILGMSRAEIRKKFDEIVAFAEVERFLDTPVKRYSSGMYVRLAFAVAAHLEPEILIVDEVLAVGDVAFQKKCLGKMQEVSTNQGRTVLFVSHQMDAVVRLCQQVIHLHSGTVVQQGPASEIVSRYLGEKSVRRHVWQAGGSEIIRRIEVLQAVEQDGNIFRSNAPITLHVDTHLAAALADIQIAIRVSDSAGRAVFTTANTDSSPTAAGLPAGAHRHSVKIPPLILPPALYSVIVAICVPGKRVLEHVSEAVVFEVGDITPDAVRLRDGREGAVRLLLPWTVSANP